MVKQLNHPKKYYETIHFYEILVIVKLENQIKL